jgi:hypothetical protein
MVLSNCATEPTKFGRWLFLQIKNGWLLASNGKANYRFGT